MKIEDQVTSLELSKQLKEKGYPQEGLWWWNAHDRYDKKTNTTYPDNFTLSNVREWDNNSADYISIAAPLPCELGEILPIGYCAGKSNKNSYWCQLSEESEDYIKHPKDFYYDDIREFQKDADTLADAMSKMYLHLIDKELLLSATVAQRRRNEKNENNN